MGSEDNIKTIQRVYEAFGRGDVATILDALADDVDWASDTSSTVAPWYGVKHGKAGVTGTPVTPASVRVAGRAAQEGCGIGDPIRTWLPAGSRNPQSRTP